MRAALREDLVYAGFELELVGSGALTGEKGMEAKSER